ncbi:MAG: nuclear transport factor 2 family protein [Dysgonamonadaceae bacterium]|jgi:hypothetical protein|nr:nuclear transport factor 2 family protein [Dysgonamonadaceae bacterium]
MKRKILKLTVIILGLGLFTVSVPQEVCAQEEKSDDEQTKQELIALCKQKWLWMADKDMAKLDSLFDGQSVFIHMGGAGDKAQEMTTIEQGFIHYKHAEVFEISARIIDNTAVVLNRIRLTAVVGGNEVVNPFMVTETYVRKGGKWKLAALAFTRLMGN